MPLCTDPTTEARAALFDLKKRLDRFGEVTLAT
jgi:hypothetical protein